MRQCTEEVFLEDVSDHKINVFRSDGVNRHLKFRKSDSSFVYGFDIITWSGYLCITGDMGCFVFSRIEDMFDFFIMRKNDFNYSKNKKLSINTGYWSEKVQAMERHGGISEYSSEKFRETIKERFDNYFEDSEDLKEKKACWEAIKDEVLYCSDEEYEAYRAAMKFKHGDFEFTDFWETNCNERPYRYVWCLYAIVWGINKFRETQLTEQTV